MRFRSYPKIGGSADKIGGPWIATEKLHGANFVVGVANDEVRFGKRKEWLAPEASFFGWQLIAAELADRARVLAREVAAPQVICYGELFGGAYPHPEVEAVPGLSAVQTGIWYCPELRWAMFDLLVARDDEDPGELIAFSELEPMADAAGIAMAPVLGRGRRDELDRIEVSAPTAMPARFGLPELANNRREGFVLKPDKRMTAGERPILKRKLPDFDDARFDEASSWDPGHLDLEQLLAWTKRLVNPARMASARSKVGSDRAAIVDEVVLDVLVDLETVFAAAWRSLSPDDEARLQATIRQLATAT